MMKFNPFNFRLIIYFFILTIESLSYSAFAAEMSELGAWKGSPKHPQKCLATLIESEWVVTSKTCFKNALRKKTLPAQLSIAVIGVTKGGREQFKPLAESINNGIVVIESRIHPSYDLALLKLKVPLSASVLKPTDIAYIADHAVFISIAETFWIHNQKLASGYALANLNKNSSRCNNLELPLKCAQTHVPNKDEMYTGRPAFFEGHMSIPWIDETLEGVASRRIGKKKKSKSPINPDEHLEVWSYTSLSFDGIPQWIVCENKIEATYRTHSAEGPEVDSPQSNTEVVPIDCDGYGKQ